MVSAFLKRSASLIQQEHKSILSAAAIISFSYLAAAFLGLVRNRLLAALFFGGSAGDLDVYFAASVIPDTIFQLLIVGALSAAFVPVYQEYREKSESEANHLANASLTSFTLILILFTVFLFIFAFPIANLSTQFSAAKIPLMANLMRLMSVAQIFFAISAFLTGVLQSHRRFLIPAIAPLFYNLGTILGILILSRYVGIYSAAIGIVFGSLLHLLIQLPTSIKVGYFPLPVFDFRHKGSLTILKLMPLRSAALGVSQLERVVSVNLASMLAAGSLTMFSFARQLYLLPITLFGIALGQASFPSLSLLAVQKDNTSFRATLSKSLSEVFFYSLPASILMLVLRIPIVRLTFGASEFPWLATLLTGRSLAFLALAIAPQAATQILVRAFYARKDTKTPLIVSTSTLILFVILSYVFMKHLSLGVVGMSLGLAISDIADFLLLYYLLRCKIGSLKLGSKLFRISFVGFVTGLCLWGPLRLLDQFVFDTTHTFPLLVLTFSVSLIGALVYLVFSSLFRIEELSELFGILRKLGNWRKILKDSDEVLETPTT